MVGDDAPTWLQLEDQKGGGGGVPHPCKPPSSHHLGWLWGPFLPPAWSLETSFLSYVTGSLHGWDKSPLSLNLYFPICVLGPWKQVVPRSPCSLGILHLAAGFSCLLPQHLVCPASLFLPQLCPSPGTLFPVNPHAALSSRVCRKVSETSPRFTPSLSRLVARHAAPAAVVLSIWNSFIGTFQMKCRAAMECFTHQNRGPKVRAVSPPSG